MTYNDDEIRQQLEFALERNRIYENLLRDLAEVMQRLIDSCPEEVLRHPNAILARELLTTIVNKLS